MYLIINKNQSSLQLNKIGNPFIELSETGSTNSYAIDKVHSNLAAHGTTYFAHNQTKGRGQRGKEWVSEPSSNIILSIVMNTSSLSIHQQFSFSVSVALACRDFLAFYIEKNRENAVILDGSQLTVKWPNDIYWGDRKAAGILIENIIKGSKWEWAIVGMGINVNQTAFAPHLTNAISLSTITKKQHNSVDLAKELCKFVEHRYEQLIAHQSEKLLADYNHHLFKVGKQVKLKKEALLFQCTIEGVNEHGQLLLLDAPFKVVNFGEVEWVI